MEGNGNSVATGTSIVLSKRIQKVLELRLENDKESLDALKELSSFLPENTAEVRRNFRTVVERHTLDINGQLLTSLRTVQGTLNNVHNNVIKMNTVVGEMRSQLSKTKSNTQSLIDQTTKLQKEISQVSMKQAIADAFVERFQLSAGQVNALCTGSVSPDMFAALDRAEEIHNSCVQLIQAGCQATAQDIMHQMTVYQETGIERIFKWTQGRCRTIEAPDPLGLLPQAMARLHSRPHLFNQILEEYCTNHRDILVRQFIDALTRGGRPIELRATEPKRYIGDMLAWLHQSIPAERDNLNYMLRNCENIDVADTVQTSLGNINEGVCHPLRVRVEHILLGEDNARDPALLHAIFNLLRYYRTIIEQVVGSGQLDSTLGEMVQTAERAFILSLQNRVSLLLGSVLDSSSNELLPSAAAGKVLALLGQLLSAESAAEGRMAHVNQMVSCVVDPLLQHVTEAAAKLSSTDMAVFLLNSFHMVQTALALYPFLDERLERLKAQCEAQLDTLTSEQASMLVAHLGLGGMYTVLHGTASKPLSLNPATDAANITAFAGKLEKLMTSPNLHQLPQLTLLSSSNHRSTVVKRAGAVIGAIYKDLHAAVHDPENSYVNPEKLLPLPPEAVISNLSS